MDKNEAIYYLQYLRHNVHADSPYDIAIVTAINSLSETKPPKSNADRIRQMTDEEIAEMLLLSTCYFGCNKCKYHGKCKGKSCTEAAIEWLKQEVSEDAGTD